MQKHANYNPSTINNDVAVLKLAKKLDLNGPLNSVCLASSSSPAQDNQQALATGWGHTQWQGTSPRYLLKVGLKVWSHSSCRSAYFGVNTITNGMICAGENGKGTCQGDSGGPLQTQVNGKWTQYGITSYGVQCAGPTYPSVYARVSTYNTWIWNAVASLGN